MAMNHNSVLISLILLLMLPLSTPSWSANTADPDAQIVLLRTDCAALADCFDNMPALNNYMWNARTPPSKTAPVLVDIGPGEFDGIFFCQAPNDGSPRGYVTLRGAGRDNTRLSSTGVNGVIDARDCVDLSVESLTLQNPYIGVGWFDGGNSTWTNVDVIVRGDSSSAINNGYAWYEQCGGGRGIHYWFNSRLIMREGSSVTSFVYQNCSEAWFYGSDIVLEVKASAGGTRYAKAVHNFDSGDMRLFGSTIRITAEDNSTVNLAEAVGVVSRPGTKFHMHGGIISVDISKSSINHDITAIQAYGNAMVHTPETAFAIKAAGTGVAHRIETLGGGTPIIDSPYLWPTAKNPPAITSANNMDLFVETDCDTSGNCTSATVENQRPHLMIYATQCGVDPWFDVATNKCRGQ